MSFPTLEASQQAGQPVEFYEFLATVAPVEGPATAFEFAMDFEAYSTAVAELRAVTGESFPPDPALPANAVHHDWGLSGAVYNTTSDIGLSVVTDGSAPVGSKVLLLKKYQGSQYFAGLETWLMVPGLVAGRSYTVYFYFKLNWDPWDNALQGPVAMRMGGGGPIYGDPFPMPGFFAVNTWSPEQSFTFTATSPVMAFRLAYSYGNYGPGPSARELRLDGLRVVGNFSAPGITGSVTPVGHFTSADQSFVFLGNTYTSELIVRGVVKYADQETRGMDLEIEVPADSDVARLCGAPPPTPPVTCIVRRVHRADVAAGTSYVTPLRTRVARCETQGSKARIVLSPFTSLYDRKLPVAVTQKKCWERLYGPVCQASLTGHLFEDLVVTAVAGRVVTIAGLGALAGAFPRRFQEGVLIGPDGAYSGIQSFDGSSATPDDLKLYDRAPAVVVGSHVTLLDGCDKQATTCKNLFGNIDNYGGELVMPLASPGEGGGIR